MAVSIIYIIIILFILRKVLKDKKRTAGPEDGANRQKRPSGGQTVSRPKNTGRPAQAYAAQVYNSLPKTNAQQQQQMRELKNRLGKKYKQPTKSSILENAKENDAENDVDILKAADTRLHESSGALASHTEEYTDVLKQVYDLMIVGYSGNLHFERDFLSEGMDMINRIGMTENNMDIIEYKINGSI